MESIFSCVVSLSCWLLDLGNLLDFSFVKNPDQLGNDKPVDPHADAALSEVQASHVWHSAAHGW